jgi:hypothetical protein
VPSALYVGVSDLRAGQFGLCAHVDHNRSAQLHGMKDAGNEAAILRIRLASHTTPIPSRCGL